MSEKNPRWIDEVEDPQDRENIRKEQELWDEIMAENDALIERSKVVWSNPKKF